MKTFSEGIRYLNPEDTDEVRMVAAIHAELLPESPVSQLGRTFMERFYYSTLVREGFVRCEFYFHEGRCAAFASYTEYPFTFMREGLRRHFVYLCFLTAKILAAKPLRLATLLALWKTAPKRPDSDDRRAGELLSFAVRPDSASLKDPASGKKIARLLFDRVIDHFRRAGFEEVQMMIREDNRPSLLFFNSYGGTLREAAYVPQGSCLVVVPIR